MKEKYILATMPEVNDDRHDVLTEAVKILSDVCDGQLEYVFSRTSAEVALKLANSPADELDEAKDALQQIRERHEELLKKFRAEKEKEIEEAYQLYLAGAAEQEARKQEEAAAAQEALAGLQMKWNPDEDD